MQFIVFRSNEELLRSLLTCRAAGLSTITSAALLRALLALCSPSAAITLALASRAASASAAMALISWAGTLTSFTSTRSTLTPQGSVASSRVSFIVIKWKIGTESLEVYPHLPGDGFSLRQNLSKIHRPEDVPQGGGGQQPGRPAVVVNVGHGMDSVGHLVVHDGVDEHRHRVFGEDLGKNINSVKSETLLLLAEESRKWRSSCRSSRRCPHTGWWRTLPGHELRQTAADPAGRWQTSRTPTMLLLQLLWKLASDFNLFIVYFDAVFFCFRDKEVNFVECTSRVPSSISYPLQGILHQI